jgi:hypothetical protein
VTGWLVFIALMGGVPAPAANKSQDPFAYDQATPLGLREIDAWSSGQVEAHDVSYLSPKGGRVPATILVPKGAGPFAGLIIQHGLPGSRACFSTGSSSAASEPSL